MTWIEVAEGVLARRYRELDQTLGLVIGDTHCLVIDTGPDEVHGGEWAAAIREITPLPWIIVITHAHWDHYLGTRPLLPAPVWAHARCRAAMVQDTESQVVEWAARYRAEGKSQLADRLEQAALVLPDHDIGGRTTLDLGGRRVELIYLGLAHTSGDLVVHVPDARVVFAGDLVEQGAPLSIGPDAHPAQWLAALDGILALAPETVVPGHGEPVGLDHVLTQRAELAARPI